jgi:DNA (cytosine-5)-methyltransferase 1
MHLEGRLRRGARRFDRLVPYFEQARVSAYASLMRTWPGFESRGGVFDHVIRYLPRDYPIFRRMNPGDQYPQAHQHAMDLLQEHIAKLEARGVRVRAHSRLYRDLKASIVPPYDPHKFPNKWRKMEADAPARTLMAHLGKDGYSHIHYDSAQARTISVREAARLQSFPDGFVFAGTMNPAFRQIGEAVPPLLANTLAHAMLAALGVRTARQPLVQRLVPDGGGVGGDVGTLRGPQKTDRIGARMVR